jgi:hypothetical protein
MNHLVILSKAKNPEDARIAFTSHAFQPQKWMPQVRVANLGLARKIQRIVIWSEVEGSAFLSQHYIAMGSHKAYGRRSTE